MKKLRNTLALILVFCLLLSGTALASVLGDELHSSGANIGEDTQLARGVFWSSARSDRLEENYIECRASAAVKPMVVYGSKVCSYGSFATMAAQVEQMGYHVIGGINGDYFDPNYQPCGILISDGVLRSSDGGLHGIGFKGDGTAIMSPPYMGMAVEMNGEKYPVARFNKSRSGGNFALFSDDFSSGTQNSSSGWDIILSGVDKSSVRINTTNTFTVEEIRQTSSSQDIPAGKFVLTLSSSADEWRRNGVENLKPGDQVNFIVSGAQEWNDVQYGLGSMNALVLNGAPSGTYSDSGVHPRTAVGVKPDGSFILYTIDGRQPGHSGGASQKQVAERLIELGCISAGIMDGGGSTNLNALYIGNESVSQINKPSDGSPRSVSNYIMLVTTAGATGVPERIGVYPYDIMILSGAKKSFSCKGADSGGYPAPLGAVEFSVDPSLGEVSSDGVFTAGPNGGTGKVEAVSGAASGYATVTVVATPQSISLWNESNWKSVSSLGLKFGESFNLAATGNYNRHTLISEDTCFTWEVTGDIGTIDENGVFAAGDVECEGSIVVSCGGVSTSIPVKVGWNNPFKDVSSGDWFYDAVQYVVTEGLFQGTSGDTFSPRGTMTRGMFVTVLGRLDGVQTDSYTNSGFKDVDMGKYYGSYVAWASENNIVNGYSDGTFGPEMSISREQMCTIIERYVEYLGRSLPKNVEPVSFSDAGQISAYARSAVEACQQAGLVSGKGNNLFHPGGTASRAEVATIIMRLAGVI